MNTEKIGEDQKPKGARKHQTEVLKAEDIRFWEQETVYVRNNYVSQLQVLKDSLEKQISKTDNTFARKKLLALFYRISAEIDGCIEKNKENHKIVEKSVVQQVI
jgi:hypothetical protein